MTSPNRSADPVDVLDIRNGTATTALDSLAALALSAGTTGGLWPYIGWWALLFGGVVLQLISLFAAGLHTSLAAARRRQRDAEPAYPGPLAGDDTVHIR